MNYPKDYINKVIQGDSLEIMKHIPDKSIDLVLTDPPYGIGVGKMNMGFSQSSRMEKSDWDNAAPNKEYFDEIFRVSKNQIIWGGNYFVLPPSRCFLVWDKGSSFKNRSFAECEMAWSNLDAVARIFQYDPLGSGDYKNRFHKTQKPVELMKWCLSFFPDANLILDPFMGSGTTGVAAKQLGRKYIGIELSQKYVDIANDRLKQEQLF